jgi:N-acetylmuramoyl-L-alanine amidase
METAEAALERLCDPAAEVSCHWLVRDNGEVCSLVAEEMRAWHAGAGAWGSETDVNSASIGIELDNDGVSPFPEAQMAALEDLLDGIMGRWGIGPEAVIGHSDMAPERKQDPGGCFDWRRLALGGRAVWPDDGGEGGDFHADLAAFGYPDAAEDAVLAAFRARFRPGAEGPVSPEDRAMAADLARRFGVDRRAPGA